MRKMQPMFRRNSHKLPGLNLASMPDLIFTVLFFFMIVTHMRQDEVHLRYDLPAGTQVTKLQQKSALITVYVGPMQGAASKEYHIQVNGKVVAVADVAKAVGAERQKLSAENQERLTVSLKADRNTPMGLIADVKKELQKAYALKINYSGRVGE